MSPVRACHRHGAVRCTICAADRAARPRPPRREYSDTAAYRAMRTAVVETYGQDCHYCGLHVDDRELVLAHVIAHADGGLFELPNLRAAHRPCNAADNQAPRDPRSPTNA